MPRTISSGVLAALAASNVSPIYLAAVQFTSGTNYYWTGIGNLSWNSQTWTGTGSFQGVAATNQTDDLNAEGVTLAFSGVDSDLVEAVINEVQLNYSVKVWLGFLDSSGNLITDPVLVFWGDMDVPSITDDGEKPEISIAAENPLLSGEKASTRRYTHDDQQIDHPGDNGFQFVNGIQQWDGWWGKPGHGTRFMAGIFGGGGYVNSVDDTVE